MYARRPHRNSTAPASSPRRGPAQDRPATAGPPRHERLPPNPAPTPTPPPTSTYPRPSPSQAGALQASPSRPGHRGPGIAGREHRSPEHRSPGHRGPGHRRPGHRRPGHRRPGHRGPGHRGPEHLVGLYCRSAGYVVGRMAVPVSAIRWLRLVAMAAGAVKLSATPSRVRATQGSPRHPSQKEYSSHIEGHHTDLKQDLAINSRECPLPAPNLGDLGGFTTVFGGKSAKIASERVARREGLTASDQSDREVGAFRWRILQV